MESERKIGLGRCVTPQKLVPYSDTGAGIQGDGGVDPPVKTEDDKIKTSHDKLVTGLDLRPEYCHYQDEGCEMAESCLKCPFLKCIYDEPGGTRRWKMRKRSKEISRLYFKKGKSVKEIAGMFGISERTVQRAMRGAAETFPPHLNPLPQGERRSLKPPFR